MSESLIGGGVFSGATPTPLGSGLNRALGLQGGELPGIDAAPANVVPVALVMDTSDRLSRGLIEPRFMLGDGTGAVVGGIVYQLQAGSGGGVLIEYFRFFGDPAGWQIGVQPLPMTNAGGWAGTPIGGANPPTPQSRGRIGAPTGVALSPAFLFTDAGVAQVVELATRIFVPPGFVFYAASQTAAFGPVSRGRLVFRELLE